MTMVTTFYCHLSITLSYFNLSNHYFKNDLSHSIYLSFSLYLSIYLSLSISIYLYIPTYLSHSIYLSISIYLYIPTYLSHSIYLSIYLSLSFCRSTRAGRRHTSRGLSDHAHPQQHREDVLHDEWTDSRASHA